MINIKGKVPKGFFTWFNAKYNKATGDEKILLSKVDIQEVD